MDLPIVWLGMWVPPINNNKPAFYFQRGPAYRSTAAVLLVVGRTYLGWGRAMKYIGRLDVLPTYVLYIPEPLTYC